MERQVIFVKRVTGVSMLQLAHKLTYSITWSENGLPYGISVERTDDRGVYEEFSTHLLNKRQVAEELALYLYENSVPPEHLHDVLHDLKVANYLQSNGK